MNTSKLQGGRNLSKKSSLEEFVLKYVLIMQIYMEAKLDYGSSSDFVWVKSIHRGLLFVQERRSIYAFPTHYGQMRLNIDIIEPFSKLKSVQTCIKGDIQGFGITISEIFWNVLMNLFNKMTA